MSVGDEFRKYEIGGPYHWKWYLVDFEGYRTFVRAIMHELPPNGTIYDIGCGDGLMGFIAALRGLAVHGIDNNPLAIELARSVCADAAAGKFDAAFTSIGETISPSRASAHPTFECISVDDLAGENVCDAAICVEVIEHVERPAQFVERLMRAVRRFAIVTTPDGTGEEPGPYDHQIWTPDEFADFLSGYRFERLELRPGTIAVKIYKDGAG